MKRLLHNLAPALILIVMAAAGWLLYRQLQGYNWKDLHEAWQELPAWRIWAALTLTVISYIVLIGYDFLAVRSIGHPLPLRKIAFGSFIGFSISYTFGALLGGTSVRYRMYSSWGLTTIEILRLIVTVGTTFWLGVFALGGVLFIIDPFEIPDELDSLHLPFRTILPLGLALLGLTAAYFVIVAAWRKPLKVRGQDVRLPGVRMSAAQIGVAALDFAVAALCLYVLLPEDMPMSYSRFLAVYMLAWVAVVVTHVPGGLAVFDLVIISLCPESRRDSVAVALATYRVIYYLLPTFIALPMFLLHEATVRDSATNRLVKRLFGESTWTGDAASDAPPPPPIPSENAPPPG
ncbi:MAG: UPF0104 family protein [Planctomyces sp.]|nr:UPF0104 family protein [Planctomyces sp.]